VRIQLTPADVGVPVAVTALGTAELVVSTPVGWAAGVAIEVLAGAVLVLRRLLPLVAGPVAAFLVALMPWFGSQLDDVATPILFVAVSCYSVARWYAGIAGVAAFVPLVLVLLSDYLWADASDHDVTDVVFVAALLVPPYVLGRVARRLALQAEQLAAAQTVIRAEAARDERDRIARELHDVIAHSVSAMVVQTSVAQDLVRHDPERAAEALAQVAETGRRALAETGRLLHVLRDAEDELGLDPVPGLGDLPELVERFRADGLDVDLRLPDPLPTLDPGVDISAYRIAREALTNALRHSSDRRVVLTVVEADGVVRISASNAVAASAGRRPQSGSGLGLLGVAERVAMLGGSVSHGTSDGRFRLDARLPVTT
jgi:signal transduction histidine kinase